MVLVLLGVAGCAEAQSAPEPAARAAADATARASSTASASPIPSDANSGVPGPARAPSNRSGWQGVDVDAWPPGAPQPIKGDRIYSKVRHLWIRPAPASEGWLGYVSLGGSLPVKGGDAAHAFVAPGDGLACRKWYAVEPTGVVCVGTDATLDAADPVIVELQQHAADFASPWPYQYAESLEVTVYAEPPDEARQIASEYALADHKDRLARARTAGDDEARLAIGKPYVGIDLSPAGKGPPAPLDLPPGGKVIVDRVALGSTVAYTDSFDFAGRTFLLLWDRGIAPKDKVRRYVESSFHGVVLGGDVTLPIAFFRGASRPKYEKVGDRFEPTGASWPRLGWVMLTGRSQKVGVDQYEETREPAIWVRTSDAAIAKKVDALPAPVEQHSEGRRSWLDVSILGGTLVAYEYDRPVYATLVSPGRGGMPYSGVDPIETASTPSGAFSVLGKFVTATMVSSTDHNLVHAEVPYTQNFSGPHALHGAYWHDAWGEKKSGGCVNLSPIDSRRIFRFTEPSMPDGWHGMRSMDFGYKTVIDLHR